MCFGLYFWRYKSECRDLSKYECLFGGLNVDFDAGDDDASISAGVKGAKGD